MTRSFIARKYRWGIAATAFAILTLGSVALWVRGGLNARTEPQNTAVVPSADPRTTVSVIRPKVDPSVGVSVEQLARVEPYYETEIRSRVPGYVQRIYRDIGQRVVRGQLLVELDVPDLVQEVAKQKSVIAQREQELKLARAQLLTAEAQFEVARNAIQQAETEVKGAEATRDLRQKRYDRFRVLAQRDAIGADLLDESQRDYQASEANVESAKLAVQKAKADLKEKLANIQAAKVDIDLKIATIDVARQEWERVKAQYEFSRLTAPIDGVVTRRQVDPGSFVAAGASGGPALLTVTRTDLVTVFMRVPDQIAPFLTLDCPATITLDDLPGVSIRGRVTRFSPAIREEDRTLRVEVDLFNSDREDYARFVTRELAQSLSEGMAFHALDRIALLPVVHRNINDRKGQSDPVPALPLDYDGNVRRMIPGMIGKMKLELAQHPNARIIPASAIYTYGGKSYILVVEDGVTKEYPVQVQINDGRFAQIAMISDEQAGSFTRRPEVRELTGKELIIPSKQQEIGVGQRVQTAEQSW